jgi:hypothetical protein
MISLSLALAEIRPILISLSPILPFLLLSYTIQWFYKSLTTARAARRRRVSGESGSRPEGFGQVVVEKKEVRSGNASVYEDRGYLESFPDLQRIDATVEEKEQIRRDKELYHKLQNLEDHPGEFSSTSPSVQPRLTWRKRCPRSRSV